MGRKGIISGIASGSSEGDALYPVGTATTGVLQIDRIPGITVEARQVLKVRDLFSQRPTTMQVVDFIKVSATAEHCLSPVPEASTEAGEHAAVHLLLSEKVRLLATWIPATKQVLDDMTELMGYLQSSLPYYVNLEEELQLLAGDDTGENLHGLIPQAQAYNSPALLPPGRHWAGRGSTSLAPRVQQIQSAKEIDPTFVILNTYDFWKIRLTKDNFGRYILGDPQSCLRPSILWS